MASTKENCGARVGQIVTLSGEELSMGLSLGSRVSY